MTSNRNKFGNRLAFARDDDGFPALDQFDEASKLCLGLLDINLHAFMLVHFLPGEPGRSWAICFRNCEYGLIDTIGDIRKEGSEPIVGGMLAYLANQRGLADTEGRQQKQVVCL